jgi:hypothetical protein
MSILKEPGISTIAALLRKSWLMETRDQAAVTAHV